MIINLVGPPAAGKSTFAARYVLEHPEFKYCPIDEYRIAYEDEGLAWSHLTKDVLSRRHVVLETCGMGWRLADLWNTDTIKRRPIVTVAFLGDPDALHMRLSIRQKRPLPPPFLPEDEHLAIDHMVERFNRDVVTPVDYSVVTTGLDIEDVYKKVASFVNGRRLLSRGRQPKRTTRLVVNKPTGIRWKQQDRVKEL